MRLEWVIKHLRLMKGACRVVLVDDHLMLRDLLKAELGRRFAGEFTVIGEAATGVEAIRVCRETTPDLLVQDLLIPGEISGLETLGCVTRADPRLKVLIFSGCVQRPLIAQALTHRVAGFVRKAQSLQTLLDAMAAVREGRTYFEPDLTQLALLERSRSLTAREREVAQLVASGRSTKEAAKALGVSVKTIDKHRSRMMQKLDVHDAVAVTHYALAAGLVSVA